MLRTAHNNKYNKSKTVFTSTCDRDTVEKSLVVEDMKK